MCPTCQGKGFVIESYDPNPSDRYLRGGELQVRMDCPDCLELWLCPRCLGSLLPMLEPDTDLAEFSAQCPICGWEERSMTEVM